MLSWANRPACCPGDPEVWSAEVKWDGQRLVAAVGDPRRPLRLDTTRGLDALERFPELAGLPAALAPHRLILDGEAVAFDDTGRPSFGQLQHRMHLSRPAEIARVAARIPVTYVVFDLLWLDDRDLTRLPYLERRELLEDLVAPGDGWRCGPERSTELDHTPPARAGGPPNVDTGDIPSSQRETARLRASVR